MHPATREELGYFVFRDHTETRVDLRFMLGGFIVDDVDDDGELIAAKGENERGTFCDWNGLFHWEATARAMGSMSNVMAAVVQRTETEKRTEDSKGRPITGGGITPTAYAFPVLEERGYRRDTRYDRAAFSRPDYLPWLPGGLFGIRLAGTEEQSQEDLFFETDRRLVAANKNGHAEMSSIVCDLEPHGVLAKGSPPGESGYQARLSTVFRVVRPKSYRHLDIKTTPIVAWQNALTGLEEWAGLGASVGKTTHGRTRKRPTTPTRPDPKRPQGDITPGGRQAGGGGGAQQSGGGDDIFDLGDFDIGSGFDSEEAGPVDGGKEDRDRAARAKLLAVTFRSYEAAGPYFPGFGSNDKHIHGETHDGQYIHPERLTIHSLWADPRDREKDAPHEHDKRHYDATSETPIWNPCVISYDSRTFHDFMGEAVEGMWRRRANGNFIPTGGPPPRVPGDTTPPPTTGDPPPPFIPGDVPPPTVTPGGGGGQTGDPNTDGPRDAGEGGGGSTSGGGSKGRGRGDPTAPPNPPLPMGPAQPPPPRRGNGTNDDFGPDYDEEFRRDLDRNFPDEVFPGRDLHAVGATAYHNMHPMREGFASTTWRPQSMTGIPRDFRGNQWEMSEYIEDDARRPSVGNVEAYGAEEGGEWIYTEAPGKSRHVGGTANGGVVHMPPEFTVEEALEGAWPSDIAYSESTDVFTPGTYLGFGWPDGGGGVQNCGFRMYYDDDDSEVHIDGRSSDTETPALRIGKSYLGLPTPTSDPSSTDAGNMAYVGSGPNLRVSIAGTYENVITAPQTPPTVSGSRSDTEQALANLLTRLAALGLITDSTGA